MRVRPAKERSVKVVYKKEELYTRTAEYSQNDFFLLHFELSLNYADYFNDMSPT